MDISRRDAAFEKTKHLNKNLKEAYRGMQFGIISAPVIGTIDTRKGTIATKNAGEVNGKRLASQQGVEGFSGAFKEDDDLNLDVGTDLEEPAGDIAGDLEVAVDANADGLDDAGEASASEQKMAADAVAQAYLGQLPSDVSLDADDNGIVMAEFHDDQHGPFKVLLFPADMSIAEVGDVKEPADLESPLDAPEEGGDELDLAPEGGDELDLAPEGGDELDLAPEEEEPLAESEEIDEDAEKIDEDCEYEDDEDDKELEEGVEMVKGAKDGIESPTQTGNVDDNNTRATHESPKMNESVEVAIEEEAVVLRESVRDRRLRKKGLIGNDRDPEVEAALREEERDPMRAGRKSWKAMVESRRQK